MRCSTGPWPRSWGWSRSGWLRAFVDARTPLLVADAQGVRIRLGHTWRGLPWSAVHHVEHTPRRGVLRDGRLVVVAHNEELVLDELDARGRRQAGLSRRLYGAPLAVPLGLATRVLGGGDDLTAALDRVALRSTEVIVLDGPAADEPTDDTHESVVDDADLEDTDEHTGEHPPLVRDPRPFLAAGIARLAALVPSRPERSEVEHDADLDADDDHDVDGEDADLGTELDDDAVVASATPSPLREATSARRSEVRREVPEETDEVVGRELRRPGSVSLVEDTQVWGDRVRPISRQGEVVEPLVIDEFATLPAADPVVGPELAAARTRLGLTVDQLADRTRIRPHVIESIEVDDFAPCGGDFYARGHLRTLARVLGIDVAPLLTSYDERYAARPDQPAPGLRGRAGHRCQRFDPQHPRRPQLVGPRGRGDGPGAVLVDRPAGDGHPDRAPQRHAGPQRLRRAQRHRCGAHRRPRAGRRDRGRRWRPRGGARRSGRDRLQGQPRRGGHP